jgi:predicted metalloendopeptidase
MKARWLALTAALCAAATSSAALDLAHLDPSVDKCTDFYDYANARWIDTATVPADRTSWGPWQELIVHNEKVLLDALDAASRAPRDGQPEWERKLVAFYRSGMDTAAIDRAGLAPLEPYLARAHAVDGAAALADALAALHAAGIGAGFGMDVEADKKDSSHYLLDIAQGGIGLPERDYYFRDDARSRALREAYVRHIAKMLQLAGADAASAERDAATILDLETALARASMTPVERRDEEKTYNRMTVEQLSERAPGFPWKRYFEALGAKRPGTLNVEQPAFMVAFAELAARRPAADWAAYLRWHILNATANALPEAFDREHFDFYGRQLLGTTQPPARPRHVIETIGGRYGSARLGQAGFSCSTRSRPKPRRARRRWCATSRRRSPSASATWTG